MPRFPAICAVMVLAATTAGAADQIASGRDLATRWCTGCHIVGPGIPGGTVGPAFDRIAAMPGRTGTTLFNWMIAPHPPMPDLEITPGESADLAAYILSLRE